MNPAILPGNLSAAILEVIPLLRGWTGKGARPFRMANLVVTERPQVIVEIGVFGGQSLIPMAMALKVLGEGGKIYGIDPYDIDVVTTGLSQYDSNPEWWKEQDMNAVREDTLKMIKDCGLSNQVVMILGKSSDCSFMFKTIDILHIDGSHTEQGALDDVLNYGSKVCKGGYIWLDDTHFPSLAKALKELEHFAEMKEDYGCYRLYQVK